MTGRTIVILGATGGVGKALAELYLAQGDKVFGAARSAPSIKHEYYRHTIVDVTVNADVASFAQQLRDTSVQPEIVINSAAISEQSFLLLTNFEKFQDLIATNLLGTFSACQEFAKLMMGSGKGLIVNFSSIHAHVSSPGAGGYAASKSAVEMLTRTLAAEMKQTKLRVVCLALSYLDGLGMAKTASSESMNATMGMAKQARTIRIEDVSNKIDALFEQEQDPEDPVMALGFDA